MNKILSGKFNRLFYESIFYPAPYKPRRARMKTIYSFELNRSLRNF